MREIILIIVITIFSLIVLSVAALVIYFETEDLREKLKERPKYYKIVKWYGETQEHKKIGDEVFIPNEPFIKCKVVDIIYDDRKIIKGVTMYKQKLLVRI